MAAAGDSAARRATLGVSVRMREPTDEHDRIDSMTEPLQIYDSRDLRGIAECLEGVARALPAGGAAPAVRNGMVSVDMCTSRARCSEIVELSRGAR